VVSTTVARETHAHLRDHAGHAVAFHASGRRPPAGKIRLGWFSTAWRIAARTARGRPGRGWRAPPAPCWRSACGTGCRRGRWPGHAPPRASISLTRWLLPMPPMAGLQLICPSGLDVVRQQQGAQPMRAAASAASVPAWPPPMTMTSRIAELAALEVGQGFDRTLLQHHQRVQRRGHQRADALERQAGVDVDVQLRLGTHRQIRLVGGDQFGRSLGSIGVCSSTSRF
jgi:hypothetical protein